MKTPVAIIIFNRPDLTKRLLQKLSEVRPSKLLVVADGPRSSRAGEAERCAAARALIDGIDWDCEILRNYSDVNLGCKVRVSSGINWVFENVEEAIILEDDCIPDETFFPFCDELLNRFRDDERMMMIAGTCFLGDRAPSDRDFYLGRIPIIWGWATWRRAWNRYDLDMSDWPSLRSSPQFEGNFLSRISRRHYRHQLDRTFSGDVDTWDFQWAYSIWKSEGLCVNSTKNLVRNLGFGPEATHTHFYDPAFDPPVRPMSFPLRSGATEVSGLMLDRIWLDRLHSLLAKVGRRLRFYRGRFTEFWR